MIHCHVAKHRLTIIFMHPRTLALSVLVLDLSCVGMEVEDATHFTEVGGEKIDAFEKGLHAYSRS
jgi:hypothetical protein